MGAYANKKVYEQYWNKRYNPRLNTYEGRALIPNFYNYGAGVFMIERWKKNKFEIKVVFGMITNFYRYTSMNILEMRTTS